MADDTTNIGQDQRWLGEQLEKFVEVVDSYRTYSITLQEVFSKAVKRHAPGAIVEVRAKSIASFGEKALLKRRSGRYSDPVNRMTDLCGARIIVPTKAEAQTVSEFVESHFEIDRGSSVDKSSELEPSQFGYRGIHYVVELKEGIFPTKDIDVRIPEEVFGLKAEIQVKTILEHAWGVFSHDRAYKGIFKIPQKWERELAGLAALLEGADNSFARIEAGLRRYAASYGAYMTEEEMKQRMQNLKVILGYDPNNTQLATCIGKLAVALGDWEAAVETLSRYVKSGHAPILRDLGVALCKLHKSNRDSKQYHQGQECLEAAIAADSTDSDAIASLAGTYRGIDEEKVRDLYRQAFEADPSDAYPLGNFIECETARRHDTSIVVALQSVIYDAIRRCRDQIDVGMNLPWAFFDVGKFHLLMGKPYESLTSYAKAVEMSTASFMIETSRASVHRLAVVKDKVPGYVWAERLLLVGQAARYPDEGLIRELTSLASPHSKAPSSPVAIVAGGSDLDNKQLVQDYRQVLLDGFRDFRGTVVSGGTASGVGRLVGELKERHLNAISAIGYAPHTLPAGVLEDDRYDEVRRTGGDSFSPLQPLQYWIDIIASGIPSSEVKLVGIGGGPISALEYRLALAFGAQVAVLDGSGGEVTKLISDDDWANSEALLRLPRDGMTCAAFLGGVAAAMESDIQQIIAQAIHENYRAARMAGSHIDDPSMASWEQLSDVFKESNIQQANDIFRKLRRIGCTAVRVEGREVAKMTFADNDIEIMAEMEHARWNVERLLDGWRWSDVRDSTKKTSPYLVGWIDLPEHVREWDRETVRKIPEFLARVGIEVRREV